MGLDAFQLEMTARGQIRCVQLKMLLIANALMGISIAPLANAVIFHPGRIAGRLVGALTLCGAVSLWAAPCAAAQPFTVADEIGVAQFQDYVASNAQFVQFSPDGEYLAAYIERGRVDLNQVEGSLRI